MYTVSSQNFSAYLTLPFPAIRVEVSVALTSPQKYYKTFSSALLVNERLEFLISASTRGRRSLSHLGYTPTRNRVSPTLCTEPARRAEAPNGSRCAGAVARVDTACTRALRRLTRPSSHAREVQRARTTQARPAAKAGRAPRAPAQWARARADSEAPPFRAPPHLPSCEASERNAPPRKRGRPPTHCTASRDVRAATE